MGLFRPLDIKRRKKQICHFSFHKNLTVYYARVADDFAKKTGRTQRHFNSLKDEFFAHPEMDMRSVNNHFILASEIQQQQPGTAFSLFIRDPRDLVVSGYFYHKRGAEDWCNVEGPSEETLTTVNMKLPAAYLAGNESISACLNRLDMSEGLQMEMEMRRPHFEAMRQWAAFIRGFPRLAVFKYEDVIRDELGAFSMLADHYQLDEREFGDILESWNYKSRDTD